MAAYVSLREPPEKRRNSCSDSKEKHLTEAAVMIAFAIHLLDAGANRVEVHPDGEHAKQFDIRGCLESLGFVFESAKGTTPYGGTYRRRRQRVTVFPKPGSGDVTAELGNKLVTAECKGGVTNSTHAGLVARLRRGICEAVGLLMARPFDGKSERHVAVVPMTAATKKLARKMQGRTESAGIEIVLVSDHGQVQFVGKRR